MRGHLAQVSFPVSPEPSQEPCHAETRTHGRFGMIALPLSARIARCAAQDLRKDLAAQSFGRLIGLKMWRAQLCTRCFRLASHLLLLSRIAPDHPSE
jgi:hypothetical protein